MYLLERYYIINMYDWVSEAICVGSCEDLENYCKHNICENVFVINNFHGIDHITSKQIGPHDCYYTIRPIEYYQLNVINRGN